LSGRIDWMRGLDATSRMQHAQAVLFYSRALDHLSGARHDRRICGVHVLLSNAFHLLGERRDEWRHMVAALILGATEERAQHVASLITAADQAGQAGHLRAALELHDDAVRLAVDTPVDHAYAVLHRAWLRKDIGDSARAARDLDEAH